MMIANEWAELQVMRKTHPGFTFLLLLAFLEGEKWAGIGLLTPNDVRKGFRPLLRALGPCPLWSAAGFHSQQCCKSGLVGWGSRCRAVGAL